MRKRSRPAGPDSLSLTGGLRFETQWSKFQPRLFQAPPAPSPRRPLEVVNHGDSISSNADTPYTYAQQRSIPCQHLHMSVD
ncbi:unnamed protein product, partial [Cuscuta europaea]